MVAMESDQDDQTISPDMAQQLVLETGALLENLSVDLALALPAGQAARSDWLRTFLHATESASTLLRAAIAIDGMRDASTST